MGLHDRKNINFEIFLFKKYLSSIAVFVIDFDFWSMLVPLHFFGIGSQNLSFDNYILIDL